MALTRRHFLASAGLLLATPHIALAHADIAVLEGPAFGASWRVSLAPHQGYEDLNHALQAIISSVDQGMSPFRSGSEISRFNNGAQTDWHDFSRDTYTVIAEALRIAHLTKGAFDPTIGGIVGRYGFGPITKTCSATYEDISLGKGRVRKALPEMTLDLCGIAKGFALDRMVRVLDDAQIDNFMIEIGGEVFARGQHPHNRPWHVGVEMPAPATQSFQHIVALDNQALATSGDSVNTYIQDGHRYTHIIDPHVARPVENTLASVSVFSPSAMSADALATSLFVMGAQAGTQFAEREGLSTLFIFRDGTQFSEITTGQFTRSIVR